MGRPVRFLAKQKVRRVGVKSSWPQHMKKPVTCGAVGPQGYGVTVTVIVFEEALPDHSIHGHGRLGHAHGNSAHGRMRQAMPLTEAPFASRNSTVFLSLSKETLPLTG